MTTARSSRRISVRSALFALSRCRVLLTADPLYCRQEAHLTRAVAVKSHLKFCTAHSSLEVFKQLQLVLVALDLGPQQLHHEVVLHFGHRLRRCRHRLHRCTFGLRLRLGFGFWFGRGLGLGLGLRAMPRPSGCERARLGACGAPLSRSAAQGPGARPQLPAR